MTRKNTAKAPKEKSDRKWSELVSLDFSSKESLTSQLHAKLHCAITGGSLKTGEKIPGIRKLAELCSTSVRVPIAAIARLEQEGLVLQRPRIGCTVVKRGRPYLHGRVLVIDAGVAGSFHPDVKHKSLVNALETAGLHVNFMTAPQFIPGIPYDSSKIEQAVKDPPDLVICDSGGVLETLERLGVPYYAGSVLWTPGMRGCIGYLMYTARSAFLEFAAEAKRQKIRSALQVRLNGISHSAKTEFTEKSIPLEDMVVLSDSNDRPLGDLRRKAYAAVKERLSSRVKRRPELVYFADDYLAAGGLLAIAELGLKIPRDIKVVALTNRGNEPASCRELTRIEHDPWDQTHMVEAVLRYLKTRRPVGAVLDSPRYIRGETF